ncbi:uncharacterized protein B0H18DRAFT_974966 [Fomitopsis serialis]|uniref:uncharacterized protein n=1 Tax=Fomitopsis serialis TaxID=139415 RepID=UPI002007EC17|nr:uncharacterized protein B0H18DRAFT_974966 [Neoantrodia serialis]KAH9936665.1 hypothetical protein B0H18DRAFT_974966 [Neoantrodia serialis]
MDVSGCRTNPASAAPHTRQAIADEITRFSNYLVDLKSRLNRLAPISELPTEILSEVFLYTAAVDGSDAYYSMWSTETPYDWIRVSHVCKHWRSVALNCPALWCNLTVMRREWTAEVLARSKKAPLYVTMTSPVTGISMLELLRGSLPEDSEETVALVLSHLARMRSLSVTVKRPFTNRTLQLLDGPVPLLESLTIRCEYTEHVSSTEHDYIHPLLHRAGAHRLRRLELHDLRLQWNQFLLPQLTHLTITSVQQRDTPLVDVQTMLDALSQMSLLEEFVMETSLTAPVDRTVVPKASTRASLPYLRHLRVRETPSNCACLLKYLETPSLSRLSLQLEGDSMPLGAALLAAVATKMASLGTLLTLHANFSGHLSKCVHLKAYPKEIDHHAMRGAGTVLDKYTPDFELRSDRMVDVGTVIMDICRLFPIRDIRNLFITARWFPLAAWRTLLHSTDKVTELFVINSASCNWLSEVLLERRLGERKETGEGHFYHYVLPQLRRLTLMECFFSHHGYDDFIPGIPVEDDARLVDGLLDCFMDRYECGAEIEQLRIVHPVNVDREEIDLLNEVVRDVDWDGTIDYQRNATTIDDYHWEDDLFGGQFLAVDGDEEALVWQDFM